MKIMFNAYFDINVGQEKNDSYGGPRNFIKIFLQQFSNPRHELVGVRLTGDKNKDNVVGIKKHREKNCSFLTLTTFLRTKKILGAKRRALPPEVFSTIKILSQALAKEKPDLLFLNGFSIGHWYLLRAAALTEIPIVAVHHGLWFKEADNVAKKVTLSSIHLMRQMEKEISCLADKEVFLNEFSLAEYQKGLKIRVNQKRSVIIPLPYNPLFERKPIKRLSRKDQVFKIGMVGRWDPIKDPLALMALAKEAVKQGKKWEFHFVTKITEVKSLAKAAKAIGRWVKIRPPMKLEKLRVFYNEMDLMILPSRFDVSPTVVIEALLQNKMTLISPNVGWVSLYEKLGLGKWIIDFKDSKKVIKRIEEISDSSVSGKLIKHIREKHQPKFVFDSYEKIFKLAAKKV